MAPNSVEPFFFDAKRLDDLASRLGETYRTASPFGHIVIDDFMPTGTLDTVLAEFPSPDGIRWRGHEHRHSARKLACSDETQMGLRTRHLLSQLNSSMFVTFLEKLTGIEGLIPDPHHEGGGLHQIGRGGRLEIHADFNVHERLRLDRRLNLLLYLNRNWPEQYGGHLELWSRDMTRCEKRVLPIFNRCVIFSTTDLSFHGHPHPLECPEEVMRKSLALYYYSQGRPEEERSASHSTLYQSRPGSTPEHRGRSRWRRFFGRSRAGG